MGHLDLLNKLVSCFKSVGWGTYVLKWNITFQKKTCGQFQTLVALHVNLCKLCFLAAATFITVAIFARDLTSWNLRLWYVLFKDVIKYNVLLSANTLLNASIIDLQLSEWFCGLFCEKDFRMRCFHFRVRNVSWHHLPQMKQTC